MNYYITIIILVHLRSFLYFHFLKKVANRYVRALDDLALMEARLMDKWADSISDWENLNNFVRNAAAVRQQRELNVKELTKEVLVPLQAYRLGSRACLALAVITALIRAGDLGFAVPQQSFKIYFQANVAIKMSYFWASPRIKHLHLNL